MAESTPTSTTFRVADKTVENFKSVVQNAATKTSICSQSTQYNQNHCTEVLMESEYSPRVRASDNGFVRTVINCYNNHHNLVIRPDDIWTAILTQFSFYINKNAEEFRSHFVNFQGKKTLTVSIDGTLRSAPYDLFVTKMSEKIDENLVDKTVKDWILPNFSTTTSDDIVSCGVVFMAAMKNYFDYSCCLTCGIPYVSLEGTVADWENILNRIKKLKDYKLKQWYDMLKTILLEFIAAKKNQPNGKFWNRICHHLAGGSGPSYISGWLTVFAVFDVDGNWMDRSNDPSSHRRFGNRIKKPWPLIETGEIPSGIVTVDVKIIEASKEYESIMFAGHTGFEVLSDDCTLKPLISWGIALKMSADEVEQFHETARGNDQWLCKQCGKYLRKIGSSASTDSSSSK